MALQKEFVKNKPFVYYDEFSEIYETKEEKEVYPSAYIRIENLNGDKGKCELTVCVYSDNAKEKIVARKTYNFTPSVADGSTNFIQQGYEYLKTLPEYAEAVDC